MSSVPSLPSIVLPPDLVSFVQSQVQSGQFDTEAEVIREALYLLQKSSVGRKERLDQIRAQIQVGLDELDRDEGQPWNKEEVWSEVRRRLDERQAES